MKTKLLGLCRSRTGSALVTVMGVIILVALVGAGMVTLGRQQIHSARRLRDYAKAQIIAESGVNAAYWVLKTNFTARNDPARFPLTQFGDGSYDASVLSISSNMASIISTGLCGLARAVARADVKNYPYTWTNLVPNPGPGQPYGFSILAGGNLNWMGNSDMVMSNGWMHCNGAYSANGINVARGNVESCVSIGMVGGAVITGYGKAPVISGGTIGTSIVASVPLVTIPDIDLTPYYNAALANGQVFGSRSLSGNVTPPGGIMWINGSLNLGNGHYTGCFIATGGVELKTTGNGSITNIAVNRYPALVSRDSTILIKQAKTWAFRGLIYCKTGSFEKQGNGDVFGIGAIIAAGDISKNGGWSGMIWSDPTPVAPGEPTPDNKDRVVITAWQE